MKKEFTVPLACSTTKKDYGYATDLCEEYVKDGVAKSYSIKTNDQNLVIHFFDFDDEKMELRMRS